MTPVAQPDLPPAPEAAALPVIIHTHLHHRHTGASSHVEAIVPALRQAGVEAWAFGTSLRATLPRLEFGALWRRLRTGAVVMHVHRNNELLFALALRLFARALTIVMTRHTGAPPSRFTRWLVARADRLICLTPDQLPHLPPDSEVLGHGVDTARFVPPQNRDEAWRQLGLPGRYGIGVVGRIRPAKGQGDFAEAIAPLLPAHPDWHVALVGWTAPKDQPFAADIAHRLGPRVTLAGEHADILPWYQGLTVLVHPSHTEGYSLVLLEAMAAGCCVVASALPYTRGLVHHGQNGFLFPPHDREALRRILAEILADPVRAQRIGRAAAEDARARLGIDGEARRLIDVYRRARPR
ncbi:MAG: glycosyltransferase family 4 protein [Myxococcaceae bacterium]|nr:glycosyltransferase family 4 protein [Myxococcaceae bacterium]